MFNVSICRGEAMVTPRGPNFDITECPRIVIFLSPFSDSINIYFKEVLNQNNILVILIAVLMDITNMYVSYCKLVTLLLLKTCWTISTLYHVFSLRFTFFHLLPCVPMCVATWIKPLLSVKMAGTLSPTAQQFPSPLVKRRSSATFPFLRLGPSNELMYKENSTLNAGPQVGIVPTRLL